MKQWPDIVIGLLIGVVVIAVVLAILWLAPRCDGQPPGPTLGGFFKLWGC